MMTRRVFLAAVLLCLCTASTSLAQDMTQQFFDAARYGDTAQMSQILASGFDVNTKGAAGMSPLIHAAYFGRLRSVRYLLAKGVPVDAVDQNGMTALMYGVESPSVPLVRALLEADADPNLADLDGNTAFMHAVESSNKNAMALLRDAGADMNRANNEGSTPLSSAMKVYNTGSVLWLFAAGVNSTHDKDDGLLRMCVGTGYPAVAQALLNGGAQVNAHGPDGKTLLQTAVERNDLTMVKLLVAAGADPMITDRGGNTAVKMAQAPGHDSILAALEHPADAKEAFLKGPKMLELGAILGDTNAILYCLDGGRPADQRDFVGVTVLHRAVEFGRVAAVRCLVARGASPNDTDNNGWTPLRYAVSYGAHPDMINTLVAFGADPTESDNIMGGLVHWAATSGKKEGLQALMAAGAPLNVEDKDGLTVLDQCKAADYDDLVALLVAAGAKEGSHVAKTLPPIATSAAGAAAVSTAAPGVTTGGSTAAPNAAGVAGGAAVSTATPGMASGSSTAAVMSATPVPMRNQANTVEVNCGEHNTYYYFERESMLQTGAEDGDLGDVKEALDAGAAINCPSGADQGATAIMLAAQHGHTGVAKELLARGAELEAEDDGGATALMYAIAQRHDDIAKMLLKGGANPNTITTKGTTALISACAVGNMSMGKTLLEAGADPNLAFDGKLTPLLAAVGSQSKDLVKLLLEKGANVNTQGAMGISPLAAAASENYMDIAKLLLAAGADVSLVCTGEYAGVTALTAAAANGHRDMVDMLTKAGAKW